jgi:hypothetical protein
MKKAFKLLIGLIFGGIILYVIAMFAIVGIVSDAADDIDPEVIYQARFPIVEPPVKLIDGGGESWMESEVWLVFHHEKRIEPLVHDKLNTCKDRAGKLSYFSLKAVEHTTKINVENLECLSLENPNDASLAGRWWLYDPDSGRHFYREWMRGRTM